LGEGLDVENGRNARRKEGFMEGRKIRRNIKEAGH
jgi:hypothetical protein